MGAMPYEFLNEDLLFGCYNSPMADGLGMKL